MGKDIYGIGHVSFIITFSLICLVFFSTIIISPADEFFFIYPVVYGILFCHTVYVRSPSERNRIFFAYIALLSTSIFCFTLIGYLRFSLLLFTVAWTFLIISKTTQAKYKLYTPITGTVLVMSIVLTQRGTLGIFNIALDRFLSIWTMGIIILAALNCIPSKLYEHVWRKAMIQFLKDFRDYLDASMRHDKTYHLDNLCQHICVLENTLNYLKKNSPIFKKKLDPRASGDPVFLYKECFESLHLCYLNLIYLIEHSCIDQTELNHFKLLLTHFLLELKDSRVMVSLSMENYSVENEKIVELHRHFTHFVAQWNRLCLL